MARFICSNCKFSFKPRTLDIKNKCPYCAKEGTLYTDEEPKFSDIDELLK